ncbi:hypothetical protein WG909_08610 [Peptostreptococcaceae bacterium AGR-M142]
MTYEKFLSLSLSSSLMLNELSNFKIIQTNKEDKMYFKKKKSFEEFMSEFAQKFVEKISNSDLIELENKYNEILFLEEKNDFYNSSEKWIDIANILCNYMKNTKNIKLNSTFKYPSFNEFIKDLPIKDILLEDLSKIQKHYQSAVTNEEEGLYEEAFDNWYELNSLLKKYKAEDLSPMSI